MADLRDATTTDPVVASMPIPNTLKPSNPTDRGNRRADDGPNLADSPSSLDALLALLRDRLAPPAELLTRETFAALLDVGISTFDRLRETGAIGPRPIHLAGLKWHRPEVLAWLRHRGPDGELLDPKTWPAAWESLRRRNEK